MSYQRRQGAAWARRHPIGSAILGIAFGGFLFYASYCSNGPIVVTLIAGAYTVYCIGLFVVLTYRLMNKHRKSR